MIIDSVPPEVAGVSRIAAPRHTGTTASLSVEQTEHHGHKVRLHLSHTREHIGVKGIRNEEVGDGLVDDDVQVFSALHGQRRSAV